MQHQHLQKTAVLMSSRHQRWCMNLRPCAWGTVCTTWVPQLVTTLLVNVIVHLPECFAGPEGKKNKSLRTRLVQDNMEEEIMPVSVSCGAHHTAVITRRGDLITWGAGGAGQTGQGVCADVRSSFVMLCTFGCSLIQIGLRTRSLHGAMRNDAVMWTGSNLVCVYGADEVSKKGTISLRGWEANHCENCCMCRWRT
jgi:hypothetical protein